MATPTESPLPPLNDIEARSAVATTDLTVRGALPAGLSGRLIAIGPGSETGHAAVHAVDLHEGRVLSYRRRCVLTDGVAVRNIIAFGGSVLAFGDGAPAYELTSDLATLHRVDLAGRSRVMSAYPKRDPLTGDLHVLAIDAAGSQAHVVVSSGALTRTNRPILAAPSRLTDLAITRDHVVFVADGVAGVMTRDAEARMTWIATGVDAPHLVHARDAGDTIVVHAVTPSLEQWALHVQSATVQRAVLDPAPRHFARTGGAGVVGGPRYLWTTGATTADRCDLVTTRFARHVFDSGRTPGDLEFVVDPSLPTDADAGWLVGFVHCTAPDETDLVVLDAADMTRPAIATIRLPGRIARGCHSSWIPSTQA